MLTIIRTQARTKHWRQAFLFISYYVTGALMPVWLSFLLLLLLSQPIGLGTFVDSGQFAIYAAAALSPIVYALSKQGSGQERTFYLLLISICLIVAAAIFSGLIVVDSLDIRYINVPFLRIASITIYAFALVATFFVNLHDDVYSEINFEQEQRHRQDQLAEQFDRTLPSIEEGKT